jgi:hypothetical protein
MADKIPYSKKIGKEVSILARTGLTTNQIFHMLKGKGWQDMPQSPTTFYKLYSGDVEAAVASEIGDIGKIAFQEAKKPENAKEREFVLRSKGGWTTKEVVENREIEDDETEKQSAANRLAEMLGFSEE